jgi:dienelactone hydrolase
VIHAKTEGDRRTMTYLAKSIICLLLFTEVIHGQVSNPEQQTEQLKASVTGKGPHQTATLTERDGIRNGPGYKGATIYYPVDLEGPLPGMVIVPGYLSSESAVAPWGPFLASHGIVTMTIGTNRRAAMPESRAEALLDAVRTLQAEQTREASPLFDRLDVGRIGVGGWSMGGGGAQLAAVQDPELDVVLALCPWKPGQAFEHPVPVMILGAELDRQAPVSLHALAHYQSTSKETPRLYFEVEGARHALAYSPGNADGDVGRIALIWLRCFLEDQLEYRALLEAAPPSAKRFLLEIPDSAKGSDAVETPK